MGLARVAAVAVALLSIVAVSIGAAGCGGPAGPTALSAADCARWLSPSQARAVLGVRSVRIATEATGATGHLDPGGVICQYNGYRTARPQGKATTLFVVDAWPHVADARRVYADYVRGLSGPITSVPGIGTRATAAPDVVVVQNGDSVVTVGTNDRTLARRIAGRV